MKFKTTSPKGDIVKGDAVLLLNEKEATECDVLAEGAESTCYALAAPGAVLSVRFATTLAPDVEEFVDLVVDGVLRATSKVKTGGKKTVHADLFERVLFYRFDGDKKKGLKLGQMGILRRHSANGLLASSKNSSTAVGSIQLQFFRKYPGLGEESADAAGRAPNFEEAPRWIDLKHQDNTFQQFGFPEFEICFPKGSTSWKSLKERLAEGRAGFNHFASCTFRLASAQSLLLRNYNISDTPAIPSIATPEDVPISSYTEGTPDITGNYDEGRMTTTARDHGNRPASGNLIDVNQDQKLLKATMTPETLESLLETPEVVSCGESEVEDLDSTTPTPHKSFGTELDVQYDAAMNSVLNNTIWKPNQSSSSKKPTEEKLRTVLHGIPGGVANKMTRESSTVDEKKQQSRTPLPSKKLTPTLKRELREVTVEEDAENDETSKPVPQSKLSMIQAPIEHSKFDLLTPPQSAKKTQQQTSVDLDSGSRIFLNVNQSPLMGDTLSTQSYNNGQGHIIPSPTGSNEQSDLEAIKQFNSSGGSDWGQQIQDYDELIDCIVPPPTFPPALYISSNATTAIPHSENIGRVPTELFHNTTPSLGQSVFRPRSRNDWQESQVVRSPTLEPSSRKLDYNDQFSFDEPTKPMLESHILRSSTVDPTQQISQPTVTPQESMIRRRSWPHIHTESPLNVGPSLDKVIVDPVKARKRKANEISDAAEQPGRYKKTDTSATNMSENQCRIMQLEARVAAAKEVRRKLEEEDREARESEAERQRVLELEKQAEDLERGNEEFRAMMAAIRGRGLA